LNINSNGYVLGFSVVMCVVISAGLALTASALRPAQKAAEEFDQQQNVLIAAGLLKVDDPRPRAEAEKLYKDRVQEEVLELKTGDTGKMTPAAFKQAKADQQKGYRLIAVAKDEKGKPEAYVFPVSGPGLWSILYGYLALDADGVHVRGITFYNEGETPGLGGECENPDWTAKWVGKSILDEHGELVSVAVKKGKVDPTIPREKQHMVDGLSGATITSNGITTFVKGDLTSYEPFLRKLWQQKGN
jgi:Na+-transporting NADH:ubiquinone oxidoreductase subunit C